MRSRWCLLRVENDDMSIKLKARKLRVSED